MPLLNYLITAVLIMLSGLFSGLNLGLLSLSTSDLRRKAEIGDENAIKVLPIRVKGNQLLTTLLLGNVAVNAALSIFLADLSTGVVGGIMSTVLIVVFGEILPQSFVSRHALNVGAKTANFTKLYLFLFWPIAYPVGKFLDITLGEELPDVFTKEELKAIISEHEDNPNSTLDSLEERIIIGALTFSAKHVSEIMTPRSMVYAISSHRKLDQDLVYEILEKRHSRIPVYDKTIDNVVGILHVIDLVGAKNNASIKSLIRDDTYIAVKEYVKLEALYNKFLKKHIHMACVFNKFGEFQGVVTLEDVFEEIIQKEVYDEKDKGHDPRVQAIKHGELRFKDNLLN